MASIPRATQIARDVPTGQAPVPRGRYQRGVGSDADMGSALTSFAEIAQTYNKSRDRFQMSTADADALVSETEIDNALDDDNDYETMAERYVTERQNKIGEIAVGIKNESLRNEFVNKHRVRIAAGRERAIDMAFVKEADHERAGISTRMNLLRESGMSGDLLAAQDQVDEMLAAAKEAGYYDAEGVVAMSEKWRTDAALGKLKMMPAEKRVEALKQDWAMNLPSDKRIELRREAEDETRADKAVAVVDKYLVNEYDETKARTEMAKISNPDMRKEVERRFDYAYGKKITADLEREKQAQDTIFEPVRSGDISIDTSREQNPDEWAIISDNPAMVDSMYRAEAAAFKPQRTMSDPSVINKLQIAKANKDWKEVTRVYNANADKLTAGHRDTWGALSAEGAAPIEVESVFSGEDYIMSKLEGVDKEKDDNLKSRMEQSWGKWHKEFQRKHDGRLPTDTEREQQIDRQFMERDTDAGWPWDTAIRVVDMTPKQKDYVLGEMGKEDPKAMADIIEYFRDLKYNPSKAEIMAEYDQLRASRGAK